MLYSDPMWNIGLHCATLTVLGAGSLSLGIVGMFHDQGPDLVDPVELVAHEQRVEDVVLTDGVEPEAVLSGRAGRT